MRPIRLAVVSTVALVVLAEAVPSAAQTRRYPPPGQTETLTVIDQSGRRTTRLTVRPRSFLDPGTATKEAFEYHYTDYAFVPNYSVFYDRHDWKGSWQRKPFPMPFDVPGGGWNIGF